MNAEKLFSILRDIDLEFRDTGVSDKLSQMIQSLENIVSSPQTAEYQTTFIKSKTVLFEELENAYSNDETPQWRHHVKELGILKFLGQDLSKVIEPIITENQLTPSNAVVELKEIEKQLKEYALTVNLALTAFNKLNIDYDELAAGECEICYSIPRDYTESELGSLDKEIHQLKFILDRFSEAVTGDIEKFEVRAISTSDYTLYIKVSVAMAVSLGTAISWILDEYKKILEIKKLHIELKKLEIPDPITLPIETYSNEVMGKSIKGLVKTIMDETKATNNHGKTKPEVKNGLENAINKLANNIDRGFQITLRIEPPEANKNSSEGGEEKIKNNTQYFSAQELSTKISYPTIIGKPILSLPESDEPEK